MRVRVDSCQGYFHFWVSYSSCQVAAVRRCAVGILHCIARAEWAEELCHGSRGRALKCCWLVVAGNRFDPGVGFGAAAGTCAGMEIREVVKFWYQSVLSAVGRACYTARCCILQLSACTCTADAKLRKPVLKAS